jgi:pimeloyl-ACP methyl ester carboxylesterase
MSGTATKLRHPMTVVWYAAMAVVLAGCQSGSAKPTPPSTSTPASAAASTVPVSGSFDVGGHKLYLSCRGTGSPTIVFESGVGNNHAGWRSIPYSLPSRTCVYARVNVSPSDQVTARHTGADSVQDLHTLLDVAAVPGPYLLVGHSFGGLLSVMYAGTYPADVVGLVLLDPTLPDSDEIDKLLPEAERAAWIAEVAKNPEKVDFLETLEQAKPLVPKIPDIPVLFLAATHQEGPVQAEKIIAAVRKAQQRFVDALPQGELRRVDTGHFIHRDAPQLVIDEVQRILDQTR